MASSQKSYREAGRTRKPTIWVWSLEGSHKALKGPLVFTGLPPGLGIRLGHSHHVVRPLTAPA